MSNKTSFTKSVHILNFLIKSWKKGFLANSYIFSGPEYTGKLLTATSFARSILCGKSDLSRDVYGCGLCNSCQSFLKNNHQDFHVLEKDDEKKTISLDKVRDLIRLLSMTSFSLRGKVVLIKGGELLGEEAANALLKTIEEAKLNVTIVILTTNKEAILPTIISRSQIINFYLTNKKEIASYLVDSFGLTKNEAVNVACLSAGRPFLGEKMASNSEVKQGYLRNNELLIKLLQGQKSFCLSGLNGACDGSINSANMILMQWEMLIRDVVMLFFDSDNFLVNRVINKELQGLSKTISLNRLFSVLKKIDQARLFLSNNVNSKSVLESLIISI